MNEFTSIFIAAVVLAAGVELWLAGRQATAVRQHRAHVPMPFLERVSLAAHHRAADFVGAKLRLERAETIVGAVLVAAWTLGGGIDALAGWWGVDGAPSLWRDTGYMQTALLIMGALGLPLEIYRTFAIEARFGFNRITAALYIGDLVKHTLIFIFLGGPLIALLLWLLAHTDHWWLWGWFAWMGFALLMLWAYPSLIAPLFNRFTPLEDTTLRQRIENLLHRCGFASGGVYVMDGSPRWTRKHVFGAEAYAAAHAEPQRLVDALVKLYEENAATLTPDALYSAYHDSHPPAPVRIARLLSASA